MWAFFIEKEQQTVDLTGSFEEFFIFKMLPDNMYGISIQFTADNAGALIQAAQFMLYEGAVNEGKLYLLRSLTVANSISTFLQAKNLELPEVSALAADLISERFEDTLCHWKDTLCLSEAKLRCLLAAGVTRCTRWAVFQKVFFADFTIKHGLSDPYRITQEVSFGLYFGHGLHYLRFQDLLTENYHSWYTRRNLVRRTKVPRAKK